MSLQFDFQVNEFSEMEKVYTKKTSAIDRNKVQSESILNGVVEKKINFYF